MSKGLFTSVLVIWISFNFHPILSITIPCHETYQAQNGRRCYPCNIGFYKYLDCEENREQARCRPCGHGEYQPSCDNSTKCVTCRPHCHPRQIKVKDCEATSDIKCECNAGSFWIPDAWIENEGNCKQHSKCKSGEELLKEGTPYYDAVCLPCQDGVSYSNVATNGRCIACSVCNTTEINTCNVTHDVICESVTIEPPSLKSASSASSGVADTLGIVAAVLVFIICIVIVVIVVMYKRGRRKQYLSRESRNTESNGSRFCYINERIISQFDSESAQLQQVETKTQNTVNSIEESEMCAPINDRNKTTTEAETIAQNDKTMLNNAIVQDSNKSSSLETREISTDGIVDLELETDVNAVYPRQISFSSENAFPGGNLPLDMQNVEIWNRQTNERQIQNLVDPNTKSNIFEDTGRYPSRTSQECKDASENIDDRIGTNENELQPQNGNNEDSVWFETYVFLVTYLPFSEFKWFYRWLAERTNKGFKETIDVQIENSGENHNSSKERIYQLMNLWRQATPKASLIDIFNALKEIKFCKIREKLLETLKSKKLLDESILDQCLNEEQNINGREVEPRGELFFANTMLPTDFGINDETHRKSPEVATHQMMELKSTREDN